MSSLPILGCMRSRAFCFIFWLSAFSRYACRISPAASRAGSAKAAGGWVRRPHHGSTSRHLAPQPGHAGSPQGGAPKAKQAPAACRTDAGGLNELGQLEGRLLQAALALQQQQTPSVRAAHRCPALPGSPASAPARNEPSPCGPTGAPTQHAWSPRPAQQQPHLQVLALLGPVARHRHRVAVRLQAHSKGRWLPGSAHVPPSKRMRCIHMRWRWQG